MTVASPHRWQGSIGVRRPVQLSSSINLVVIIIIIVSMWYDSVSLVDDMPLSITPNADYYVHQFAGWLHRIVSSAGIAWPMGWMSNEHDNYSPSPFYPQPKQMPSALPLMTECETRKHNYLVMIVIMRTMEEAVFAAETMGVIKWRHENGCSIDGIRGQTPPMTTHIRPLEQNWWRGWWRVGVYSRFSSTFLHSLYL